VGELNNFQVKLVKVQGEFMWHHHDEEDEMFLVTAGELHMKWRDAAGQEHDATIRPGEPATTLNTGNIRNERTVATLEKV
jgi:mannose-6-phosphate isomerase-like protein (cupin superfamily)